MSYSAGSTSDAHAPQLDDPLLRPEEAARLLAVKRSWITKPYGKGGSHACGSDGTSASREACWKGGSRSRSTISRLGLDAGPGVLRDPGDLSLPLGVLSYSGHRHAKRVGQV
jgi:hypothetical protein